MTIQEPAVYVFTRSLTANQAQSSQGVAIDRGRFVWTSIHGTQTGTYTVNFEIPAGRRIGNAQMRNANIVGTAQFPVAIAPIVIERNGQVNVDITDTSGASNTVEICLAGYHEFEVQ